MKRSVLVGLLGLVVLLGLVSCGDPSIKSPADSSNHNEPSSQSPSQQEDNQDLTNATESHQANRDNLNDTDSDQGTAVAESTPSETLAASDDIQTFNLPATADPARGAVLFETFQPEAGSTCSVCHRADSDERLIGPGLKTIGTRATDRVVGMSAAEYIYESIVDPDSYIVDGYPDIMPRTWHRAFTEDELYDLIAYLMSLKETD